MIGLLRIARTPKTRPDVYTRRELEKLMTRLGVKPDDEIVKIDLEYFVGAARFYYEPGDPVRKAVIY